MLVDLVLSNAKIYTQKGIIRGGIAIDEGRIFKIAKEAHLPPASRTLGLKGLLALPGLIDPHVHLRDQQLSYKEDFSSGTAAAAAGGVTSVIDMPNNRPVTMSTESLRNRMQIASRSIVTNVAFISAFPQSLSEIYSIVQLGAVAFKLFLSERIGGLDIEDDQGLLQAFHKVSDTRVPIAVHAEDRESLRKAEREVEKRNQSGLQAYLKVHSSQAERRAIHRILNLIKNCDVCVHFCHLSSAEGLKVLEDAKEQGLPVTCEVTPHHLFLTSQHLRQLGTMALTNPPLRKERDVQALWRGLTQGLIDVVSTDHAPHSRVEKRAAGVWGVEPGIPGLETLLPLLLTVVNKGQLSISRLVQVTSERPAEIFNLKGRGGLVEGNQADIAIIDVNREYKIDVSEFHSQAEYSPFEGWRVKGKPVKTFVNGELAMDEGRIVAEPGTGHVIGWQG
ncbi:amidohydrolase family protein [Candidatus Bathyarchaeota archaeon]|nr:dihydroorotase family protein [Candidatus Bathyarchaeota archaeon]NIU81606.1 amidohydrolase family protein [Candidatus Bathyarchaeota archaeon]NIV68251.1 amidohydrolase family protein [Candidatus Bathyarchaeota archaeon]NIW15999.1 amidohydrolase family protein [Candidatus Bathyarchaeota archaeon]NIW34776.1 amidohydrolase family protein [Candidatus Bathyarchaeota archaeon]